MKSGRAKGSLKSGILGVWLSAALAISVLGAAAGPSMPTGTGAAQSAGIFDDIVEYLECVLRMLQGEECIYDADGDGEPDPVP